MELDWCFDTDLKNIEQHCWGLLHEGVKSYKNPFHYGVFASVDDRFPSVRTVIVREVDIQQKIICFNTDTRSPKFGQLSANPHICWLFYDENLRMQMRCMASASLHVHDELADAVWKEARLNSKITYTAPHAPGTPLDEPCLVDLNRDVISDEELQEARRNFSVVHTRVISLDWTFLHYKGNRRAFFDYQQNRQTWMQS